MQPLRPHVSNNGQILVIILLCTHSSGSAPIRTQCIVTAWEFHLVPTTMTITARGITWLILKEVVRLHGIPESSVSDRDTRFTPIFWKELHRLMGSKLLMSTVFHPQTDGAMERANRSIAQVL